MSKKFLVIIILFLFQACSFDGYKKERDSRLNIASKEINNESAIIITKVHTNYTIIAPLATRNDKDFTEMNWCRDDEQKKCKDTLYFSPYTRIKFNSYSNNQYDVYEVKPGYYYLDKLKENQDYADDWFLLPIKIPLDIITFGVTVKPNFNTSPSGWNKEINAPNFASFKVNAGEVIYLGDLYFDILKNRKWLHGKINLEIKDNYSTASKYFHLKFPQYKNRQITKRLVQPGVLLDNYDAGIFW